MIKLSKIIGCLACDESYAIYHDNILVDYQIHKADIGDFIVTSKTDNCDFWGDIQECVNYITERLNQ